MGKALFPMPDYFFEKIFLAGVSFFSFRVLIDSEGVNFWTSKISLLHLENRIVVNRAKLPFQAR